MSLFTVLKYGGINLHMASEVEQMPDDLISQLYDEIIIGLNLPAPDWDSRKRISRKNLIFSITYRMYLFNRGSKRDKLEKVQQIFLKVLKEYKEPE